MSEYSYEIDKYIVGVDSNGEDGIGLTIATMKDNELHILGSCYGDNARFIDLLIKENQKLKKQLEYLRSGEYYNQLRFERDMLQDLVDKKEISKEDKEFIDMTQRNTELLEENQKLKKLLEEKNKHQIFIDTQDMEERYAEGLYQDYLEEENKKYKNQQKEFIEYLENEKDRLARECSNIYEDTLGKTRFVNEDIFNEVDTILSKYKEIIGGKE